MKKLLCLGLLIGSIVSLTGCATGPREGVFDYTSMEVDKIDFAEFGLSEDGLNDLLVKKGYLTVGTSPDYAPYSFLDIELNGLNKVQGAESAIAFYVAKSLGLELKIKEVDFSLLLADLGTGPSKGSIDAIFSGLTYSEDRAANYQFSDSYYNEGDGGQVLIVKKENASLYTSIEDLNLSSVKIGAQAGALQEELVTTQLVNATVEKNSNTANLVTMLNGDKIDLMASSKVAAQSIVENNSDLMILEVFEFDVAEYGTMGLLQKNNDLVLYINAALSTFESSTYATWLEEYKEYALEISIEF